MWYVCWKSRKKNWHIIKKWKSRKINVTVLIYVFKMGYDLYGVKMKYCVKCVMIYMVLKWKIVCIKLLVYLTYGQTAGFLMSNSLITFCLVLCYKLVHSSCSSLCSFFFLLFFCALFTFFLLCVVTLSLRCCIFTKCCYSVLDRLLPFFCYSLLLQLVFGFFLKLNMLSCWFFLVKCLFLVWWCVGIMIVWVCTLKWWLEWIIVNQP